jgi:hypothetical protein
MVFMGWISDSLDPQILQSCCTVITISGLSTVVPEMFQNMSKQSDPPPQDPSPQTKHKNRALLPAFKVLGIQKTKTAPFGKRNPQLQVAWFANEQNCKISMFTFVQQ